MQNQPAVSRIAVLYSELSGYMAACLKTLKSRFDVELLVYRWPVAKDAPFDEQDTFGWIDQLYSKDDQTAEDILRKVEAFAPDGVFIPGWMDQDYLKVARVLKRRHIPVVAGSDTQWEGTLRQRASKYLAPWYLHTAIDALWVAGERQRQFASYLGYSGAQCWSGYYACDWEKFAIDQALPMSSPAFLFVGRYSREKGIDVLIEAYKQYRKQSEHPWKLICAGTGDQKALLQGVEGIEDRGFVQPDALPALMQTAQALVLPSRKEPWGVVVQEAAAVGLPLLCSTACGATVHLLQDGFNGYLFESENASHLTEGMRRLSHATPATRAQMGQRSRMLAAQFTPERWAQTLVEGIAQLKRRATVAKPAFRVSSGAFDKVGS